ncbi:MAG: hypothetical protein MUE44_20115 [Oscillatoriaceae cyanobacterium Prado104]|jgi:spermidine/putrescine transport system substrate-binding protein|nr:hypothetical protein [Oscillatoriaceae cyanobacterium Prado104]
MYTWAGYTDRILLDRFAKKTGIRAIADVYDSSESMLTVLKERSRRHYSIIQ